MGDGEQPLPQAPTRVGTCGAGRCSRIKVPSTTTGRPTHRSLAERASAGVDIDSSVIADWQKRFVPLSAGLDEPLVVSNAMIEVRPRRPVRGRERYSFRSRSCR